MKPGFLEKLLERIERINPEEVQSYLLRLVQEKGFLEQIFNALQEGILVVSKEGRIDYLNTSAAALFGLNVEEALGSQLSDKVRGLEWDELTALDRTVSRDMEIFYPQNRFINFYVVPLGTESGDVSAGHAIILRDITATRRTTQDAIESERMSALTLLAAGVAHELGNPLNSLNIHLQLMERKARKLPRAERAEFEDFLRISREEINRLDTIINQFLRAIRPTVPDTQPCDLNILVQESVAFLSKEIQDRDILVEQELRSDLPLLDLDRAQIKQAFYNIIKNAFQAMRSGGLLRIGTDRDDAHVIVRFSDNGSGISPEDMGKIFQPYHTTKTTGSGLGLMIVRRIVREHGGEIAIESDEGKGVTFTIRLPLTERRVRLLQME